MKVSTVLTDGAAIVSVHGEVDLYSSPGLRQEIVQWAQKRIRSLIVDLGGVTYMDSSGIATLVEGFQLTKTYGGRFSIASPGPAIQEVLRFAHLDRIFHIFGTVEEALKRP
ncbi:MAG: STAS domain-containing protein [Deltaproteobacteria bacterium]|nr:STAS domain-containing protein [Deltaproteobacteria bacterium]MBW2122542.1 STAS domain-containing protein [Deltaproteobacteria bacterium]